MYFTKGLKDRLTLKVTQYLNEYEVKLGWLIRKGIQSIESNYNKQTA